MHRSPLPISTLSGAGKAPRRFIGSRQSAQPMLEMWPIPESRRLSSLAWQQPSSRPSGQPSPALSSLRLSWQRVPAGPWPPWQLQLSPWPNVCGWPTSAVQRGHEVVELAGNIRRLRLEPETLAGKGDRHRAAFEPRLRRWCVQANGGIMDVCRCQWRRRRSARQCRASLRPARPL